METLDQQSMDKKSDWAPDTECCNHPETPGVSLCDSCNRFLCAECLGPPKELNYRAYYFCQNAACQKAYKTRLKPRILFVLFLLWTLAFPLITLAFYLYINLLNMTTEFTFRFLGQSIVYAAITVSLIYKALRGRQEKRK